MPKADSEKKEDFRKELEKEEENPLKEEPKGKAAQAREKSRKGLKKGEMTEEQKRESQRKRFMAAQVYAKALVREFKRSLKAVIVYGSTAKGTHKEKSDIDVFVVIDDTKLKQEIPVEVKDKIWGDLRAIADKVDKNITIQAFMFLTEFWESVRSVEPLTMEILRAGIPVFDVGIFLPAKRMLQRGNLPATSEAVIRRIKTAPEASKYAKYRVKSAAHHMEQAMANAGQAALMAVGRAPPAKEDVGKELEEHFVKQGLLDKKYADIAENIHKFAKEMEHEDEKMPKDIGAQTDRHMLMLDDFIERMEKLVGELEEQKRSGIIVKTYKTFLKANVGALELKGVTPPEKLEDLPKVVYQNFPELKEEQMELFDKLAKTVILAKKGKAEAIPEGEMYALREQTRIFIYELGRMLKRLKDEGKLKDIKDLKEFRKPDLQGETLKGKAEKGKE